MLALAHEFRACYFESVKYAPTSHYDSDSSIVARFCTISPVCWSRISRLFVSSLIG